MEGDLANQCRMTLKQSIANDTGTMGIRACVCVQYLFTLGVIQIGYKIPLGASEKLHIYVRCKNNTLTTSLN